MEEETARDRGARSAPFLALHRHLMMAHHVP